MKSDCPARLQSHGEVSFSCAQYPPDADILLSPGTRSDLRFIQLRCIDRCKKYPGRLQADLGEARGRLLGSVGVRIPPANGVHLV